MTGPTTPEDAATRLALLETLLRHAPVGFAMVDREFRFVHINDILAATHGMAADAQIGKTVGEVIPHLWPTLEPLYWRALAGETVINEIITDQGRVPGGRVRHLEVSRYPVHLGDTIIGVGVIVDDVTERWEAEAALQIRNNLYAMLAGMNRAVSQCRTKEELFEEICTVAVGTGRFQYAWIGVPADGRIRLATCCGRDDGYGRSLEISLDPGDESSQGPTGRAFHTGEAVVVNDFVSSPMTAPWHDQARQVGFAASASFPFRERGAVVAVLNLYAATAGFFTDDLVTTLGEIVPSVSFALDGFVSERDRLRDETALHLLDGAVRAVSQGIVVTDPTLPDNPIIYASPSFERLTGYSVEELEGRNCRFLQGRDTAPAAIEQLRLCIGGGRGCTVELLNYRKDGTPFWNSLTISPVLGPAGELTHFVGVQTDVTERRRLEEQYRQAQKMEAVGQLASGVAHDFNNLLTVISGCSALLLESAGGDAAMREDILSIQEAGERAGTLTRQLLAFSRQQVLEPRVVSLNAIVNDTQKMLRRLIGENVILTTVLRPELGLVRADPGQLEQILFNLAVNARDAMPAGGHLTLETQEVMLNAADCEAFADLQPGPYVLLAVHDTGCGMSAATQARIFEPFFTTKGVGKGTGLGLATVHGIIKQSQGHIVVYSEVGQGTTFTLYLPRVTAPEEGPSAATPIGAMPRGTETVLLVEDEPAVRALTRHVLRGCGYTVLEAADGMEATQIAADHPGVIHLLISDVIMPHLGGRELAERIARTRPACRILFLSGYTDDERILKGVEGSAYAFLQKPFTPALLAQKVRAALYPL